MSLSHNLVTLSSSSATLLNPDNITTSFSGEARHDYNAVSLSIQNVDATATVYLGSSSVTSSSYGVKLAAGAIASIDDLTYTSGLYAISSVNGSQVGLILVKR